MEIPFIPNWNKPAFAAASIVGDEPEIHTSVSLTSKMGFIKSACSPQYRSNASVCPSRVDAVSSVLRKLLLKADRFTTWFIYSNIMHHLKQGEATHA
jgi:hypothetical protein